MSTETPWWEAREGLIGGLLTPQMAQDWSALWASRKGFSNAEMAAALIEVMSSPVLVRPRFPMEIIREMEKRMVQNAWGMALAGNLSPERVRKLADDFRVIVEQVKRDADKIGVSFETPQSREYRAKVRELARIMEHGRREAPSLGVGKAQIGRKESGE